jgi:hypothetical protein
VIEVTHEMVTAFMQAAQATPVQVAGRELLNARAGLAAVLALAERDYQVTKRHPITDPFGPIVDPCVGCGCAKDWHTEAGCAGDFMCCPCETWMPVEPATPPQ